MNESIRRRCIRGGILKQNNEIILKSGMVEFILVHTRTQLEFVVRDLENVPMLLSNIVMIMIHTYFQCNWNVLLSELTTISINTGSIYMVHICNQVLTTSSKVKVYGTKLQISTRNELFSLNYLVAKSRSLVKSNGREQNPIPSVTRELALFKG